MRLTMATHFGKSRLPELLAARHMSQAEFARKIEISEPFVSQIISGTARLSLLKARRAAKVLKCNIDDLYEWID
jgi:transcriptional regulator with XRE-family HTH domain